jgi:hypothetical protein
VELRVEFCVELYAELYTEFCIKLYAEPRIEP